MKKLFLLVIPLIAGASFIVYDNQIRGARVKIVANNPDFDQSSLVVNNDDDLDSDSIAQSIKNKKEALKDLILSIEEAPAIIENIKKHQREIAKIEKRAGITKLQKQIAQLRQESCKLQQDDPRLSKYRKQIENLSAQIRNATISEQKKVRKLIERAQAISADSPKGKEIAQKMKQLQERAQSKTKDARAQLDKANQQLRKLMAKQIDEVRPLIKKLKERQDQAREQVKPHYDALKRSIKKLAALAADQNEISQVRQDLKKLRARLNKLQPCQAIQASSQSWEELIA